VKRSLFVALLLVTCLSASASAQDWAKKMFKVHSHDFGAVARGSKTIYEFELENLYEEDVHIASVRASCGCTLPSISKDTPAGSWANGARRSR
jgi:hypothetical protein